MSILTRANARSVQPTKRVTSSRANHPRRQADFRQDNAVVTAFEEVGSHSTTDVFANRNQQVASFTISKCVSRRCKTCPQLKSNKTFLSNVTKKNFKIINHSRETITCHS